MDERSMITQAWARRARWNWAAATMLLGGLLAAAGGARADALDTLKGFVRDVKSGRASFTQVVSAPGGTRKKTSTGTFEFERPSRFRFDYAKPYEQVIVADGTRVWLYDVDLNQVTVRPLDQTLGTTPAAVLAGGTLERDFNLKAEPDEGGLQWAQAVPKAKDGGFQSLRVGFRGRELAAMEIIDAFGQRSRLDFTRVESNVRIDAARFSFTPPPGADVLKP
jgi:outer membrane lipoprotein carrier protein